MGINRAKLIELQQKLENYEKIENKEYNLICSLRNSGRWNETFVCRISKCDKHNYTIV